MSSKAKRYYQIFLLILAGGSIYPLVYLRTNFSEAIMDVYAIDEAQLSTYYTMLGLMFIFGYIPSGWLADRISSKLLVVVSLFMTGVIGIWYAQVPSPEMLIYAYIGWGIFTVFTFWGALIRSVNLLATKDEQSRAFGFLDGGRGLVEALLALVAVTIYINLSSASQQMALSTVIYFYSAICILLSILIFIFLTNPTGEEKEVIENDVKKGNILTNIVTILKKKEVWLLSGIIFTGYMAYWTIYYFSSYLVDVQNYTVEAAAFITALMLWMRPIGGMSIGYIGDKFGREKTMMTILLAAGVLLITLSFIPVLSQSIVSAIIMITALVLYMIRGLYWSLLDDAKITVTMLGLAIGIVSFLGYLPDIIAPQLIVKLTDSTQNMYATYFLISGIVALIGIIVVATFQKIIKKRDQK